MLPELRHPGHGARYFFAPQMIALWLLLAAMRDPRRWLARSAGLALLWMLAMNLPRLREPGLVDFQWGNHAAILDTGEPATVPINPEGWTIVVPARPR